MKKRGKTEHKRMVNRILVINESHVTRMVDVNKK